MVGVGTAASWWEVGNRSAGPRREEQGQSICSAAAAAAATADTMGRTTLQRHERGATNEVDVSAVRRQSSIASRQSSVVVELETATAFTAVPQFRFRYSVWQRLCARARC